MNKKIPELSEITEELNKRLIDINYEVSEVRTSNSSIDNFYTINIGVINKNKDIYTLFGFRASISFDLYDSGIDFYDYLFKKIKRRMNRCPRKEI